MSSTSADQAHNPAHKRRRLAGTSRSFDEQSGIVIGKDPPP